VLADQPAARTTFFDAAVARHAVEVEQFVVLGAGLDTRAQRLPAERHIRCFEVDTPKSQAFKLAMLQRAGVSTPQVTYVSADFEQERWLDELVAAGFDPSKPSFFLWESVCMYLDRKAVESTLRAIAGTGPGNVVAFDYLAQELVEARSLLMRYARTVLGVLGEPWTFGIEVASAGDVSRSPEQGPVALVALLESCGLSLAEHQTVWQDASCEAPAAGFVVAVTRRSATLESRRGE
jgi:methyltransferase (TIGR00027 family)